MRNIEHCSHFFITKFFSETIEYCECFQQNVGNEPFFCIFCRADFHLPVHILPNPVMVVGVDPSWWWWEVQQLTSPSFFQLRQFWFSFGSFSTFEAEAFLLQQQEWGVPPSHGVAFV